MTSNCVQTCSRKAEPSDCGRSNWLGVRQIKCKRKRSSFLYRFLSLAHTFSPVIMTSAPYKIITGNCAGWCAGRSENQAIVCRSRMMTNMERERQLKCFVCVLLYLFIQSLGGPDYWSLDIFGKWCNSGWSSFLRGKVWGVKTWFNCKGQS